ncbi:MAG: MFS transporter [Gammaproteobacteria bacterium]
MPVPYWRLSGFYFFYFATLGALLPYWSLYLKDGGFNSVEIGELSALLVATRIIAPNVWGWLADRTGRNLTITQFTLFFGSLSFTGFFFVHDYGWLALTTLVFGLFWNAALPQFETITLFHLRSEAHRYSRIRLWGSIGFIVTVMGLGWMLDRIPVSMLPSAIIGFLILNWLITLTLPESRTKKKGLAAIGIIEILKKREVAAFLIVCMLLQVAHGPYYVFYSVYLKEFHYTATFTGSLWALGVLSEIVLFICMRPLLSRFTLRSIILASLLLSTGRWLIIAWYADNLALLIIAQLCHAASFGSAHVAAIHLVQDYFGEEHQNKGQALYSSLSFGLGGMLGSLYSGYFWESLGPGFVYSLAALFSYLAFLMTYFWIGQENPKMSKL